ncbi:MAG TPA: BTAD domain-containing putative transcriptional regulator [Gemmatimonadales bacterium]|nr:BTAD domain-containing putative transcriptional regulator [Gemmatimonadales bacterium]
MTPIQPSFILQVLGPPDVHLASGERAGAGVMQPRRLATLVYLALARPRGLHARDTLIALLWPEADEATARHALRNSLHAIRAALGEHVVVTAGGGLVGLDPVHVACDALALEADLAAGRVDAAIARYSGELLTGFHVSDAPEFERWLDGERRRLHDAAANAAWLRADALRAAGDPAGAARLARWAHERNPDDELALRRLMQCLDACGDRSGAIRAYEAFAGRLAGEFGAEPSSETVTLMQRLRARAATASPVHIASLAVLPFIDRSGRGDGAELCEGVGSGIANRLARLARFHVTARGALAVAAVPSGDPVAAGRDVGADAVVTGVLAAGGGQLRIRIEVIRVSDGRLLLGDAFGVDDAELYTLEAHVAAAVCRAAGATASDELDLVTSGRPARHGEAYLLYLRGQHRFLRAAAGGHPDDLLQSRELFEQALALDPTFAPAVAGLSNFYAVAAARNRIRPFAPTFARAIELSHEALALDPMQAIPHVHLGVQAMFLDGDWDEAERRFQRVRELDPSYPEGHRFLAILRGLFGRHEEALALLAEAVRLEPRIPTFRNGLAAGCMALRRYDAALAELRLALELDPRYWAARERLIRCHERLGDFKAAIAERCRDERAAGAVFAEAFRRDGVAGYRDARAAELRTEVAALEQRVATMPDGDAGDRFNPPELRLALAHAELADWDAAFHWETQASRERAWRRQWFVSHPDLAPLAAMRAAAPSSSPDPNARGARP